MKHLWIILLLINPVLADDKMIAVQSIITNYLLDDEYQIEPEEDKDDDLLICSDDVELTFGQCCFSEKHQAMMCT